MHNLFLFSDFIADDNKAITYLIHFVLVIAIILVLAKLATSKMQLVPKGIQNIMEMFLDGVLSMGKDTLGSKEAALKYVPLIATLGLVVFVSNIIGIIPGFEAPSASLNLTLPLAIIVFIYYHYEGIKTQGFCKYFKHFFGPVKVIAPLMFVVEVISHFSRIVSLSFRLFGNIKGDDLFLGVILALVPIVAPLPPYFLLTFMAFLQSFVFMILTYVYIASAIAIDEEH
ncbi:F0F1 ATP synthase subunit A [Campylobacter sp. RM12640]|uniref:F0F1 ATP synthase subunit A n=1 Tax=unclassified Campylobacter TaxID=2593542 RepID=UPI001E127511|nr:F0F1 ATP synthase subunit A [Campylobacter sp. RM12640]MBZ7983378.1 F0F1 ATP synthase subunit A [Campylobacter sp. RM12647]MBZ7988971.1 F0F1 ATP synthase subunit A [Campylobacter sp. RM12635]